MSDKEFLTREEMMSQYQKGRKDFRGIVLSGDGQQRTLITLRHAEIANCDFGGAVLPGFKYCHLHLCNFDNAVLTSTSWRYCRAASCSFIGARIAYTSMSQACFWSCVFDYAVIGGSHLNHCEFDMCSFHSAALQKTDLQSDRFSDCVFTDASLERGNICYSSFLRCETEGVNYLDTIGVYSVNLLFQSRRHDCLAGRIRRGSDGLLLELITGCYAGSPNSFREQVRKDYGDSADKSLYLRSIDFLEASFQDDLQAGRWDYLRKMTAAE